MQISGLLLLRIFLSTYYLAPTSCTTSYMNIFSKLNIVLRPPTVAIFNNLQHSHNTSVTVNIYKDAETAERFVKKTIIRRVPS